MIYNQREGSGDNQSHEVLGTGHLMIWTFKNGDKRLKARLAENSKYEKWIDVTQWREHIMRFAMCFAIMLHLGSEIVDKQT
eukprot:2979878-Pyramimonas_sp.AAC.1